MGISNPSSLFAVMAPRSMSTRVGAMMLDSERIREVSLALNKRLLGDALTASNSAYAEYSGYRVGAAVETENGDVYFGCNVENASYSITVCAERSAIAAAVLAEGPKMRIRRIAVAAKDKRGRRRPCTPCGACRQFIAELGPRAQVIFIN